MGHIPIHAEGEGGECVDTQVDQGSMDDTRPHISWRLEMNE